MAAQDHPKRPRLSLQIKPSPGPNVRTKKTSLVNPRSPTSFNTLSNVYATAIERSTPVQETPVTAINTNTHQALKLQTDAQSLSGQQQRVHTPFTAILPDTPLSANPMSPAQQMDFVFPSTMTATPPLSAGPVESPESRKFTFAPTDTNKQAVPQSPAQTRRRVMYAQFGSTAKAPYSHNRSLHSILRNSPLPPSTAVSPSSSRRQSLRLQEKAARRVGYESPLTQTITTEKYTKSHIDLLQDEASPYTPSPTAEDSDMMLDLAMAYSGDETRDGGETPGPFEEMRRRMTGTGLGTETPILSPRPDGIRKRKRKEKKRRWVWTIGQDDEENESGAMAALRAAANTSAPRTEEPAKATTPEPLTAVQTSFEHTESESDTTADKMDIEMSDRDSMHSSRATTPHSMDMDTNTPTVPAASNTAFEKEPRLATMGLATADLINPETGTRRDTPIPPDLVNNSQL
ncbi:hypothetical protein F5B20DRAFT_524922 [Whalleya microplaca]|nr:hypothetical protein F5B20DRAFT_524922 [Whalleya microplaca]